MTDDGAEAYLLDTNVASAAWDQGNKAHSITRSRLLQLDQDRVFISSITIAEIEYGLKTAPSLDSHRQQIVRREMSAYKVLSVDRHTAEPYSDIRAIIFQNYAPRDRRGRIKARYVEDLVEPTTGKELGIQENDLWIVSVAIQYNLVLVTNDLGGGMRRVIEAAQYAHRTEYWNPI